MVKSRSPAASEAPQRHDTATDPARLERLAERCAIPHENGTVVWRRFGSGPPLVLLHGGHGNWLHWARNIDSLSRRHTLWVPDMPGFGDSDALPGSPHAEDRLDRLVQTLAATLDSVIGAGTAISMAGFSFGGLAAAHLAARRPAVSRLALLGPAGHGGARRQAMAMLDWRQDDRTAMLAALRHNLLALMLHDPDNIDDTALAIHEQACRATRFRSKSLSRQGLLAEALDAYGGAALLLWGEHDVTAEPIEAAQRLAAPGGNRDWCLVPGAGHWVQYERAEEVNAVLLRWFADPATRLPLP